MPGSPPSRRPGCSPVTRGARSRSGGWIGRGGAGGGRTAPRRPPRRRPGSARRRGGEVAEDGQEEEIRVPRVARRHGLSAVLCEPVGSGSG
jgi:hypothetical protein